MIHQAHTGPLATLGFNPFGRYYGPLTTSGFYPVGCSNGGVGPATSSLVQPLIDPALKALHGSKTWPTWMVMVLMNTKAARSKE